MCTNANRTHGILRRNFYQCPQAVKEAAYRGFLCPVLEHYSCVWDPHGGVLQQEIDTVQNRTARFATSKYCFEYDWNTGGKTKMGVSQKRRRNVRQILCTMI